MDCHDSVYNSIILTSSVSDPKSFIFLPCMYLFKLHTIATINYNFVIVKGSLVGETSVLRTFRMSKKELVKERVSQRKS